MNEILFTLAKRALCCDLGIRPVLVLCSITPRNYTVEACSKATFVRPQHCRIPALVDFLGFLQAIPYLEFLAVLIELLLEYEHMIR